MGRNINFPEQLRMLHVTHCRVTDQTFKQKRMKKQLLYLIICISISVNLSAAYLSEGRDSVPVNDGPYIFYMNDTLSYSGLKTACSGKNIFCPETVQK
jgi:hypothetical protein